MVDFTAHFTIRAVKIGFQIYYILPGKCCPLKVVHLPIACQSERSLRYFHLTLPCGSNLNLGGKGDLWFGFVNNFILTVQ